MQGRRVLLQLTEECPSTYLIQIEGKRGSKAKSSSGFKRHARYMRVYRPNDDNGDLRLKARLQNRRPDFYPRSSSTKQRSKASVNAPIEGLNGIHSRGFALLNLKECNHDNGTAQRLLA
jgi:hypothetical protein